MHKILLQIYEGFNAHWYTWWSAPTSLRCAKVTFKFDMQIREYILDLQLPWFCPFDLRITATTSSTELTWSAKKIKSWHFKVWLFNSGLNWPAREAISCSIYQKFNFLLVSRSSTRYKIQIVIIIHFQMCFMLNQSNISFLTFQQILDSPTLLGSHLRIPPSSLCMAHMKLLVIRLLIIERLIKCLLESKWTKENDSHR